MTQPSSKMPDFDDLLEHIGEFDFFQKRVFFLVCFLSVVFAPVYVGVVFLGFIPEHRCRTPGVTELSNRCGWTLEDELNHTVPKGTSKEDTFTPQCMRYNVNWNESGLSCTNPLEDFTSLENRSLLMTTCQDGWVYDASVMSIVTEVRSCSCFKSYIRFCFNNICRVSCFSTWIYSARI